MFVNGVVWIVIAAATASCSRKSSEKAAPVASKDARPEEGTMMQVEIEGPLQTLRANTIMPGLEMQRRVDDLGGGRWRAYAIVTDPEVIETLEGRGLTVRVVMDEQEMDRRMHLDLDTSTPG